MAKTKKQFHVVTIFDGDCDVTDVFTDLIAHKIGKIKEQEYLAIENTMQYNENRVQEYQQPSGLCG